MAPAVGPTSALAMCAAAFVGWQVPFQRAQSFESDEPAEPEVPDSAMDNSDDFCESAAVQEHFWTHQNTTSETAAHEFGFSETLGDGAMDDDWERGNGAVEIAHDSEANLHNAWILADSEGSQNMQRSGMFPVADGDDEPNSLCNSDSKEELSHFQLLNGSGFQQEAYPRVPSEFVKQPEFCTTSDLSVESEAIVHHNEFESLTEFASLEAETVSEVEEPKSNNSSDPSTEPNALTHNDEFGSLSEVAVMEKETISEVPQRSYDVLDNRVDVGLEDDVTAGWNTEGHNQSSIFDKALGVLHQQWHSCLAISRSVLGEELFLKVSEVMVRWWYVVLLSVASLFDLALYAVFGGVLLRNVRSCCRRGTRRETVPAELDVADTEENADSDEEPIFEQIETAHSATLQVPAPVHDVQRESACQGGSVDAMKCQRSPFSAIQVRDRRVATAGFARSQNMVASSVSTEQCVN